MSTPESPGTAPSTRSDENRVRLIAALTLGAVMAGHTLLETARDALFLANISVERLPIVTIAIAALALVASRGTHNRENRTVLLVLQGAAVVGTLGLWSLVASQLEWSYYILYVWSGIITTLIVVRFWLLLSDLFTITQGKRLFAAIGLGGSVGALLGSGVAAMLAPRVGGEGLLVAAAAAYGISTLGPAVAMASSSESSHSNKHTDAEDAIGLTNSVRRLLASPYACRVAVLVMLGGVTFTLGDYLFKSVLAQEIAPKQLATSISQIYLGLNVLSIAMLGIGVTPVVRRLGVDRSLAVLPLLMGVAGLGVIAGGALAATIFLKAADGTLRYSLHKTATELLYLPMSSSLRSSVKGTIDIIGQTGAKALASVLILGLVLLPESRMVIAGAVAVSSAVWFVLALRLRRSYLDVFRNTLNEGIIETAIEHPELDLESAASLIRALSGQDVRRVIASMRILVERGHVGLIPSLILYHPSAEVVTHALDTFAKHEQDDIVELLGHLIEHDDANVRAAAVRADWMLRREPSRLLELLSNPCLAIRVSAMAGSVALGQAAPDAYRSMLDEVLNYETSDARLAAIAAACLRYHRVNREPLLQFSRDDDAQVAQEAIRAMCASGDEWFTEPLVDCLGDRRIREVVRGALLDRGDDALRVLVARLVDKETPIPVLRHVPRTIARFGSPEAARALIEALPQIESGMVRYKLLRGLETLLLGRGERKDASMQLATLVDTRGIRDEFDRTLARSLDLLGYEVELVRGQEQLPERKTVGSELLIELLQDKRELATGRIFTMLGLLYVNEDFRLIKSGLENPLANSRASSQELIENLLSRDIGNAILGLVIQGSAVSKLQMAAPNRKSERLSYGGVVRTLMQDGSHSMRAVALYHAGEICLDCSAEDLPAEAIRSDLDVDAGSGSFQDRAARILRDLAEKPTTRARSLATG